MGVERRADGSASYLGLIKCRCKACAPCLARRRARYAEEIQLVADLWADAVGHPGAYLATFTIRHGMGDCLELTGRGVRAAWRSMVSSKAWQDVRRRWELEYIVAEEVTFGGNGWHPHLHVLFLPRRWLKGDPNDPTIENEYLQVADLLAERWALVVQRTLGESFVPDPEHGTDFRPAKKSEYISKCIGLELADPGTKRARRKGRTPVQLLADWADHCDEVALERYQEYEQAMGGRRDLTWSRGLRSYRQRAQRHLDEVASAEGQERLLALALPAAVWDKWRHKSDAHARLLEAVERETAADVEWLLRRELGQWAVDAARETAAELACSGVALRDLNALGVAREARAPP